MKVYLLISIIIQCIIHTKGLTDSPKVSLSDTAKLQGFIDTTTNGREFYSYKTIPYAKPPIGELRFKDPVPAEPWNGVRNAKMNPSPCIQHDFLRNTPIGSENCLFLHVFTPSLNSSSGPLPVMVYIHGGGFYSGHADQYGPQVLLDEDIVLVVIQYRLGVFGFLSTEDDVMPGNFGLKDQTLALKWVQKHIQSFGGDAERVTIFGESAGSASVHYQLLTPYSKGLFHRAILQSGTALSPWAWRKGHRNITMEIARDRGCKFIETSEEALECLRKPLAEKLLQYTDKYFVAGPLMPNVFCPRTDGDFIPEDPSTLLNEGRYQHVDVLAGITKDEGLILATFLMPNAEKVKKLNEEWNEIGKYASLLDNEENSEQLADTLRDYFMQGETMGPHSFRKLSKLLSTTFIDYSHDVTTALMAKDLGNRNDVNLFLYQLNHHTKSSLMSAFTTWDTTGMVGHADDIGYMFNLVFVPKKIKDTIPKMTEDDLKIRSYFVKSWANFAATGNPTPDKSLGFSWDPATLENFNHLSITTQPSMQKYNRKEVRDLMSQLPLMQNEIIKKHDLFSIIDEGGKYKEEL